MGVFVLALIMQTISVQSSNAQCVACYQTSDGSCTTELVNRNGAEGCGCDTGCNCSGQCTYVGEAFNIEDVINYEKDIPETGLMVSIESHESIELENLLNQFRHEGVAGEMIVSNVWFQDNLAIYRLNENDFMIFPVKDNKMNLLSCDGEYLTTIYDKSIL
ncbi:hypothetical protein BH23BAC3_BH23BAC3_33800 [soil metagenome]